MEPGNDGLSSATGGLSMPTDGLSTPTSGKSLPTGGLSTAIGGLSTPTSGLSSIDKDINQRVELPAQPSLADFGLFECLFCGKYIKGIDQAAHLMEVHSGLGAGGKKIP